MNKRISPKQIRAMGFTAFGTGLRRRFVLGDTGYMVLRAGHPTCLWPWYGLRPDGSMVLSQSGRAFAHVGDALKAVVAIATEAA